jgi:hypothetical protein
MAEMFQATNQVSLLLSEFKSLETTLSGFVQHQE